MLPKRRTFVKRNVPRWRDAPRPDVALTTFPPFSPHPKNTSTLSLTFRFKNDVYHDTETVFRRIRTAHR